jgi:hypothetical protein
MFLIVSETRMGGRERRAFVSPLYLSNMDATNAAPPSYCFYSP